MRNEDRVRLLHMIEATEAERSAKLKVVKKKRLSDLFGALRSDRPFAGKEAIREEVGRGLGQARREKESVKGH